MNGASGRFSTFRTLCHALPIVLGIAIILASVFPAFSVHAEHFADNPAQAITMSDHADPSGKKVQDHKAHAICSPGMSCFAFTVPVEETSTLTSFGAAIEWADFARLVTTIVAPPVPPPKIIILV